MPINFIPTSTTNFLDRLRSETIGLASDEFRRIFNNRRLEEQVNKISGDAELAEEQREHSLSSMVSSMIKKGGFARPTLYKVEFGLKPSTLELIRSKQNSFTEQQNHSYRGDFDSDFFRDLLLNCSAIEIPGINLNTTEVRYNNSPVRKYPYAQTYPEVNMTFYASSDHRELQFFHAWQNVIVTNDTHSIEFYENYIANINIYQLAPDGKSAYKFIVTEAYPLLTNSVNLSYSNFNEIETIQVQFAWH